MTSDSFVAGDGHLDGSKGRNRLISTTKDDVLSALSYISDQKKIENNQDKPAKIKVNCTLFMQCQKQKYQDF